MFEVDDPNLQGQGEITMHKAGWESLIAEWIEFLIFLLSFCPVKGGSVISIVSQ